MNPTSCNEVTERLWRYVDRELPASDLAAISAHVGGCESCRALYHEKARDARRYREALLDSSPFGEAFVTKVLTQMRAESLLEPEFRARGPLRSARFRALVGIAALLLLIPVLVAVVVLSMQPRPIGSFEVMGAPVQVGRVESPGKWDMHGVVASRGQYFAGGAFTVPEGSRVILRPDLPSSEGETTCEVTGGASFYVEPEAQRRSFRVFLQTGSLEAHVRKLEPGESFEIETPHAVAAVVGTAFRLQVDEERTVLSVEEGKVLFTAFGRVGQEEGESLCAAGESWVSRTGRAPEKLPAEASGETTASGAGSAPPAATASATAGAGASEPTEPGGATVPGDAGSGTSATGTGAGDGTGIVPSHPGTSSGGGHTPLDEPVNGKAEGTEGSTGVE